MGTCVEKTCGDKINLHGIQNPRVLALDAVVTHKVMIMDYLPFDLINKDSKGGLNTAIGVDGLPPSLCAEALTKFLTSVLLREEPHPPLAHGHSRRQRRLSKRTSRPGQSPQLLLPGRGLCCVLDLGLTFGWTGSPGDCWHYGISSGILPL